jgi:molybdopterin converting factor subunit 1
MASIPEKAIHIQYFALLREQRGLSKETLKTAAATAQDLYAELKQKHGFSLGQERLSVAVNEEFASWQQPLQSDDNVVFIPPVAGG